MTNAAYILSRPRLTVQTTSSDVQIYVKNWQKYLFSLMNKSIKLRYFELYGLWFCCSVMH